MTNPQSKGCTIEQTLNPQGSIFSATPAPKGAPAPSQPFTIEGILNPKSCCPGLAKPARE